MQASRRAVSTWYSGTLCRADDGVAALFAACAVGRIGNRVFDARVGDQHDGLLFGALFHGHVGDGEGAAVEEHQTVFFGAGNDKLVHNAAGRVGPGVFGRLTAEGACDLIRDAVVGIAAAVGHAVVEKALEKAGGGDFQGRAGTEAGTERNVGGVGHGQIQDAAFLGNVGHLCLCVRLRVC